MEIIMPPKNSIIENDMFVKLIASKPCNNHINMAHKNLESADADFFNSLKRAHKGKADCLLFKTEKNSAIGVDITLSQYLK